MAIVTARTSRDFIRSARLPPAPKRPRRAAYLAADASPIEPVSAGAQSLVVGSGLVVAAENVPARVREDLVNCTLFAQLAASGSVGDQASVVDWYHAYFHALTVLGWAQSDTRFESHKFRGRNAEAHKAVTQVLRVLLGPETAALAVVEATLEALQSVDENAPWLTLFDRQSRSGTSARFQVAAAQMGRDGLLQIALAAFSLKARSEVTQVLFFKYASSSTRVQYAAGMATIYEEALAKQRTAIAARLAAYRAAYVGEVKFPPP